MLRSCPAAAALLSAAFGAIVFAFAVATGGAAEPAVAADRAPEAQPRTREQTLQMMVDDQQKEIVRLTAENERLRKQVADLKTRELVFAPPTLTPRPAPPAAATPKGAVPHEFNGETYYVIPLRDPQSDHDGATAAPAK